MQLRVDVVDNVMQVVMMTWHSGDSEDDDDVNDDDGYGKGMTMKTIW